MKDKILNLASRKIDLEGVLVLTIDECEGAEMSTVFLDTVVTHKLGFMNEPNRLLVGWT